MSKRALASVATTLIVIIGCAFIQTAVAFSTTTSTAKRLPKANSVTPMKNQGDTNAVKPETPIERTGSFFPLFYSRSSRYPSLLAKQLRRFTVFRVAAWTFIQYKWAQFRANRVKRRLKLSLDDPDSDDHPEIQALWSQVHRRSAQQLLQHIQRLEGFWVKVGQYLSSRGDVMPPEYLDILSQLQDSMPPRSWDDTWRTVEEELDSAALERLEHVEREPLSTASLAQVHRAVLRDDDDGDSSRDVVLKVQHRGVASLMLQDMENLRVILELLAYTDPDLDFGPVIREYNREVRKELDFRVEAKNMKDVRQLLKQANCVAIIPETVAGLVTERVLVMDFCHG